MPNIDRREFVKLVGTGGVGVGAGFMLAESIKHPVEYLVPYAVAPEDFSPGIATWYNSVCGMCPAGCGISVRTREGRAKKIEGNPAHPVSQGRLCSLGQAGLQDLYNPDRITSPRVRDGDRGSGVFRQISWDEGLSQVAARLTELKDGGAGGSICLITGGVRGQLESVLGSFMDELGSERFIHYEFAHPHTLYTSVEKFYGETRLPYFDLENADYLLSFGADYLSSWLSPVHQSLGFGRGRQDGARRMHAVQIEPRMSLSGAAADEWIPANPGTEGIIALGIARQIVESGRYQGEDLETWADALSGFTLSRVAEQAGVSETKLLGIAQDFMGAGSGLAIGGGAAGHQSNGVATLMAVHALNYLAGNLGQTGGVVFNPDSPLGTSARGRHASYTDLVTLTEEARRGEIQALILVNADPVFAMPRATDVRSALSEIPFIVSLSRYLDDSSIMADVVLPSHSYLESWGDDAPEPGVGFPVASVSQPVVAPLFNTRSTGDIIIQLGQQLGFDEAMPWGSMEDCIKAAWQEIYAETASDDTGEDFASFYRSVLEAGVWGRNQRRTHGDFRLGLDVAQNIGVIEPKFAGDSEEYPFVLHPYLSTALRDGRGANLPWLQELPDPMTSAVYGSWVEINPTTADELGYSDGDLVEVASPVGSIRAPVLVYPAIMPGVIAMPIGQGHGEFGRYARNRGANPIQILAPQVDDDAGSLAWGATRVKLVPTGESFELVKTGGKSRQLGRGIVQTTGSAGNGGHGGDMHSSRLNSIPITVESA